MNDTGRVHKAKRVYAVWRIQASLVIHAVPWEQSGSPAAMQPGVHPRPCECSLAVFSSLGPWNQAMGAGRKDWVSFLFYLYFPMNPPNFATLQNEGFACCFFCVLLRGGTERAG